MIAFDNNGSVAFCDDFAVQIALTIWRPLLSVCLIHDLADTQTECRKEFCPEPGIAAQKRVVAPGRVRQRHDYRRPMAPVSNSGCYARLACVCAQVPTMGVTPDQDSEPYLIERVQRPASPRCRAARWWRQVAAIHMIAGKANAMGRILIRSRS